MCEGSATPAFTNATPGGTWSITNGTGTASIDANGVVTGLTAGTVTVVYTVNDGTCSNSATAPLTVNPLLTPAVAITGVTSVCSGVNATYTATASNTDAATVAYDFKVDGISQQNSASNSFSWGGGGVITCEITLSGGTGCFTTTTATSNSITQTVNPRPTGSNTIVAAICTPATLSIGLQALITNSVASNFVWVAASNANVTGESTTNQTTATINNTLTNATASQQTVVYTVTPTSTTGSCAGSSFTVSVPVNPQPQGSLSGNTVCEGAARSAHLYSDQWNRAVYGSLQSWKHYSKQCNQWCCI